MYNNINPNIIAAWGKFVFLYEIEKLSKKNEAELKNLFPNAVAFFEKKIMPLISLQDIVSKKTLLENTAFQMAKVGSTGTGITSFLRHMRNVFAHGKIDKSNEVYTIIDFEQNENEEGKLDNNVSAFGELPCTDVEQFFYHIINEFEKPEEQTHDGSTGSASVN